MYRRPRLLEQTSSALDLRSSVWYTHCMSNYDTWLSTNPNERVFPPGVEDALGDIILWPEGFDEDTLVPEFGEVTGYEEDEPDGEYDCDGIACWTAGAVYLEVTALRSSLHTARSTKPERCTVRLDDLDEYKVPAELAPVVQKLYEARRAEQTARGAYNRYDNARRQVGYDACIARSNAAYDVREAAR